MLRCQTRLSTRRSAAIVSIIGVVLALATACGSSSKAGTSPTSSSSVASAKADSTPINVGNIGSYSGPLASSGGGFRLVIEAWAKSVNAAGGINGHPVNLIVKDDAGNAAQALTAAKRLVEGDHVVAIVANASNVDSGFAPYLKGKGIPVIGGIPIAITNLQYSNYFPGGTNLIALFYGLVQEAKAHGTKLGLMYCAEAATCAAAGPLLKAIGAASGVSLVYSAKVSASASDYTAQCQALKASGATSYYVGSSAEVAIRVTENCKAQGVTANPVTLDGSVTEAWAAAPALSGTLSAEADFPFIDASVPASQAYQTAIAKYAPTLGSLNGPNAAYGWVAGELFQKAVENGGTSGAITTASVLKGLYAMKGETLGGIAPPLTYTPGKPTLINCYFTMGLENGKFTTPDGLKTTCAPDDLIAPIAAKLTAG